MLQLHNAVIMLVSHPELVLNDEQLSNLIVATTMCIADCQSQGWHREELPTSLVQLQIAKLAQSYY